MSTIRSFSMATAPSCDDAALRIDGDHDAVRDEDIGHTTSPCRWAAAGSSGRSCRATGRAREARGCRRAWARRRASPRRPSSTISPAFMTATRSHICLMTARSWLMNSMESPVASRRSFRRLRICAWTETSSEDVGSSQIEQRGPRRQCARDGRCAGRWPPEKAMGNASATAAIEADRLQQQAASSAASARRSAAAGRTGSAPPGRGRCAGAG